jgi:hypothetical protein
VHPDDKEVAVANLAKAIVMVIIVVVLGAFFWLGKRLFR